MLPIEELQERIEQSELGQEFINNPLLNKDTWALIDLGYTEEEVKISTNKNIYFTDFLLPWLKLLTKLTVLAMVRQKFIIDTIKSQTYCLKQLDVFLSEQGYTQPELLTNSIVKKFVIDSKKGKDNKQQTLRYVSKLWTEEKWLKLSYTPIKYQKSRPKTETIPEEVLYQIYQNFHLFSPPLERLFRLQLALGARIGEMLRMPRQCLKKEGEQWFLLKWIEKRKHWRYQRVHLVIVELVREQQKFLDKQLGINSNFPKLFCNIYPRQEEGTRIGTKRFELKLIYTAEVLSSQTIQKWLRDFREEADLRDKHGNRFNLQSHMFRRTKASIMTNCGVKDEYIAAVLGHGSLDMLPHYRQRSLDKLEKEADTKGYVDMYGRVTTWEPKKPRYKQERLAELLAPKFTISSGNCHRPDLLGDCELRYACLSCEHHRVRLEDKPLIESDIKDLQQDLEQAQKAGKQRRVTEVNRFLGLLTTRLQGLEELENLKNKNNEE